MQTSSSMELLGLREQAEIQNRWLSHRLRTLLPKLMASEEIDTWVVVGREYNEDPVLLTLLPAPMLSARRRTILVFHREDSGEVDAMAICRYGLGNTYRPVWTPEAEGEWQCLARLINERSPRKIAINVSRAYALADGLTASELESLRGALGTEFAHRLVSAEDLAVRWLESRSSEELQAYPRIARLATTLIEQAR